MTTTEEPAMSGDAVSSAVAAAYDARAATYDESAMHRDLAAQVVAFCMLDGVHDVLDVATGTGLVLRALWAASPRPPTMTGVDLSPDMLAVAQSEVPAATLLLADAATLPLADDSADLVTCVTALHLMSDPRAVLAEWVRVLRPGGRAVTATFTAFARPGRSPSAFATHHDRFAGPGPLAAEAASAGLCLRRHAPWRHTGGDAFLLAELEADA